MVSYEHGGNIYRSEIKLDFSVNVNPLGIPRSVEKAFIESVKELSHYPDSEITELNHAIAAGYGVPVTWIVCGNGCADLIFQVVSAQKPRRAVVLAPSFEEYETALRWANCEVLRFHLQEENGFVLSAGELMQFITKHSETSAINMLFLCNPNNPTGLAAKAVMLEPVARLCESLGIFLVVDECFCEFADEFRSYTMMSMLQEMNGIMILKAFTKTFALAGLRLGYAICPDTNVLTAMKNGRQPWSVSIPAQRAGMAALAEKHYLDETRCFLSEERKNLSGELSAMGFTVYPSTVNYLLFANPDEATASLGEWCKSCGILIRSCGNFHGLTKHFYRVCIKNREENDQLVTILREYQAFCSG